MLPTVRSSALPNPRTMVRCKVRCVRARIARWVDHLPARVSAHPASARVSAHPAFARVSARRSARTSGAAAGGARGRARTYSARTALCDARVIPYAARTTLSGAPATFQARATRAKVILRRGIPLIPLNPAEFRFQFKFCRRCEPESDRDPGEKFVLARNSHRGLSLWTIDRLSQSFAACSRPRGSPSMSLSHCGTTDRAP